MLLERLNFDIRHSYEKLREMKTDEIFLIYHDDADGLSAGAVAYKSLERLGFRVKLICIEKIMDQIIRFIHKGHGRAIVYVDIASPHADKISIYNSGRNYTLILDHHDPVAATDPLVYNINPEFYGLMGERDASGSVMTYYYFRTIDEKNIDLAHIALIGAQEIPGEPSGLIKLASRDAESIPRKINYKKMFRMLQILGPVGYYQKGPMLGIKACIEGINKEISRKVEQLEAIRKVANKKMMAILYREGLNKTRYIQWFDSKNIFRGMGTKVIGTFASYLSYQKKLVDDDKYIVGFMRMPSEIPGLMKLEGSWTKVSIRVTKYIREKIDIDVYPGVNDILIEAAEAVGGLGDGHKYAASATIPSDMKEDFITELDRNIGQHIS
jgi:hypothetical protein